MDTAAEVEEEAEEEAEDAGMAAERGGTEEEIVEVSGDIAPTFTRTEKEVDNGTVPLHI